jgi:alpha-glucoside transport system substrate-binding protein
MNKFVKLALLVTVVLAAFGGSVVSAQEGCPAEWTNMSAELTSACAGELSGTTVTMTGPFIGEDEAKFVTAVEGFESWTGIDIAYTGTSEFEAAIRASVEGGAAPDIVDFPQPGLLRDFVLSGDVLDLAGILDEEWLTTNYAQSWLDMSHINGITAGVWNRFNGKSVVWYPVPAFADAGYTVPTTWEELIALADQIVADGGTPFCVGIGSGAATGWPATDWIEDIMLRTTSVENYDAWSFPADAESRLPFTSPEVMNAAQTLEGVWFAENYVLGGSQAIAATDFRDAPLPMFQNPPRCYMHRQANFITSFFPGGAEYGVDYDFFYLPPIDEAYGRPFLVAGDIYSMFHDRPEVRAVMDFFTRGESVRTWVGAGGALSPHNDTPLDWYGSPVERQIADLVANATSVRFDGSDLMPGAVGSGSFWKGMTDWVSGTVDLETALTEIDAAWPSE